MEQFTFGYSTKNIPISSQPSYLRRFVEKTEQFLRNLRWRAFFFLHPDAGSEVRETYGFKSRNTPPVVDEWPICK